MAKPAAARPPAPPAVIEIHLARDDREALLYLRESTGHDASAPLGIAALRDLRARIDAAIAVLEPPSQIADPSQEAIERSLARVLHLVDERRKTAPTWRARVYAMLLAHSRNACPEAEVVTAAAREAQP